MSFEVEFKAILELETNARDYYDAILSKVRHERVRKNITIIRDDEIRHIEIAKRLLEIVQR